MSTKVALTNVHFSVPGFGPGQLEHHLVHRGEAWDFDDAAWARLSPEQQAGFGTPDDLAAQIDAEASGDLRATDDAIRAMSAEEVTAYLNQLPETLYDAEAVRVLELERQRSRPRKTVLDIVDPDAE